MTASPRGKCALRGLPIPLLFAVALAPARPAPRGATSPSPPAPAAFAFHLPEPDYASRPGAPQAEPVTPRIRWLVHPTPGAPAIARAGGVLRLRVAEALAAPARGLKVVLETRVAGAQLRYELPVVGLSNAVGAAQTVLTCVVPARAPRETYDLAVTLPDGRTERHRRAVRLLHRRDGPLTVAVLADHQLWDPSGRLLRGARHPGAFPSRGARTEVEAMARQGRHELALLDPDVVLHLGDLVYGLDPGPEMEQALALMASEGPATFLVPGNHDGYARFGLDLKASLPRLAVGMVECRRHLPTSGAPGWRALWAFLSCVYGDLKPVLFRRLLTDGLHTWRRTVGPTHWAFRLGRYRLIGLNTYDGSPARRHAYALWVDIRGLHLGAPMVDNYGGYLSMAQLQWLEREAREAAAAGETLVVLGHHDPRGNATGAPYHPNQPFPTDPVGPDHFEAWNYDGPWDSDPADGRGPESATDHSGHALLRVLARNGGLYLSGHVHRDRVGRYPVGAPIRDGVVARREVTFLTVTTASAAPRTGGYWGYRLLTLGADGRVAHRPFAADLGLPSVPAGNLWMEPGRGEPEVASLHTGLPRPVRVRVTARLPQRPEGWAFALTPAPAEAELLDVTPLPGGEAVYTVAAHLPAAGADVAQSKDGIRRFSLRASPVAKNRPPRARLRVDGREVAPGGRARVAPGARLTLEADGSADPDGHALLPPLWEAADGRGGRGWKVALDVPARGDLPVSLTLTDAHGAARRVVFILVSGSGPAPAPSGNGAGCGLTSRHVIVGALLLILFGGLLVLLGRRRE